MGIFEMLGSLDEAMKKIEQIQGLSKEQLLAIENIVIDYV